MHFIFKKAVLSAALLLAFCGMLAGCKDRKPADVTRTSYKLAVMVPETGPLTFIGQPMRSALILAQEDNRSRLTAANSEIELVFADTQGSPREAVTQFARAVERENANGVITTLSGVIGAISPLAKGKDLLFIGLSPDPTYLDIVDHGLRVLFSFDKEGLALADLMNSRGWHRVLILHSTDSATTYEVSKVLVPRLNKLGLSVAVDTFNVGQSDFKDLVAKYGSEKWDGVVLHGFGSELPSLGEACLAYPNLASAPKLSPLSTLDVRPNLRGKLTGIQFFAPAFLAKPTPEYDALAKKFSERFPHVAFTYSAVYAYDAYILLCEALIKRKTTNAAQLKEELLSPKRALTQEYKFSSKGDFQPEIVLLEIAKDGSLKAVK